MSFRLSANSFGPFSCFPVLFPGAFRSARLASGRHEMRPGELSGSAGLRGADWRTPQKEHPMNEKTELINRRIELAQADPPALFVLSEDAKAEDLDAALRIIFSLRSQDPEK